MAAFQPPEAPVHSKLRPYFEGLSQLANGQPVAPPASGAARAHVLNPQQLPLHADDIALLRRATATPDHGAKNKTN